MVAPMVKYPFIEDGLARLRSKWPQSHCQASKHGAHLIIVPSVLLPHGWDKTICTVLFIAPPGFPAANPHCFFTDIDVNFLKPQFHVNEDGEKYPKYHPEDTHFKGNNPGIEWPAWKNVMWWKWCLQ